MFEDIIRFIKDLYGNKDFIPLHEPVFPGNEKKYLADCVDSTYVSSVGSYVTRFEKMICDFTGSAHAVATMNGTAALHMALVLNGVDENDEVLSQALTFVATCNAIAYTRAKPVFIDSAKDNLGMCPDKLDDFLRRFTEVRSDGICYNRTTGKRIRVCVPMHAFGHPVKLDEITQVCAKRNIVVVEDAAESLGSWYREVHTGTASPIGVLSFNGNKTITCGSGGMLLIRDADLAKRAKHLTTTAKVSHAWDFVHDEVGYNYRLPNINAAMACAQMESLPMFLKNKRETAGLYAEFFSKLGVNFLVEPDDSNSNYWLNAVILTDLQEREAFLEETNRRGVMTRPLWKLMNKLPAFKASQATDLTNARFFEDRVVNIPSSVRL